MCGYILIIPEVCWSGSNLVGIFFPVYTLNAQGHVDKKNYNMLENEILKWWRTTLLNTTIGYTHFILTLNKTYFETNIEYRLH